MRLAPARVVALAAGALALGVGAPVWAQGVPKPGAAAATDDPVDRMYTDGKAAAKAGDWERARLLFEQVWAVRKEWLVAAQLARAELNRGRYRDAAEHMSLALRDRPSDDPARKELEPVLVDARARVGALRITASPPGAEVVVNGQAVGTAPLPGTVFIDPGPVVVEARLPGYVGARADGVATAGGEQGMDLRLVPMADQLRRGAERRGPNKAALIGGSVTGGVLILAGAAFAVMSTVNANNAADQESSTAHPGTNCGKNFMTCSMAFDHDDQQRRLFAGLSVASFIAGGAAVAGTWIYGGIALSSHPKLEVRASFITGVDRSMGTLAVSW